MENHYARELIAGLIQRLDDLADEVARLREKVSFLEGQMKTFIVAIGVATALLSAAIQVVGIILRH